MVSAPDTHTHTLSLSLSHALYFSLKRPPIHSSSFSLRSPTLSSKHCPIHTHTHAKKTKHVNYTTHYISLSCALPSILLLTPTLPDAFFHTLHHTLSHSHYISLSYALSSILLVSVCAETRHKKRPTKETCMCTKRPIRETM